MLMTESYITKAGLELPTLLPEEKHSRKSGDNTKMLLGPFHLVLERSYVYIMS